MLVLHFDVDLPLLISYVESLLWYVPPITRVFEKILVEVVDVICIGLVYLPYAF